MQPLYRAREEHQGFLFNQINTNSRHTIYCIHACRCTVRFQPGGGQTGGWAKYWDMIPIELRHIWQRPLGQTWGCALMRGGHLVAWIQHMSAFSRADIAFETGKTSHLMLYIWAPTVKSGLLAYEQWDFKTGQIPNFAQYSRFEISAKYGQKA